MKLSFNFSTIYSKAKQNTSILLLIILAILILMEAWTLKGSWTVLSDSTDSTLIIPAKLIRINFNTYDAIVKRVDNASNYAPQPFIYRNPFGIEEKDTPGL